VLLIASHAFATNNVISDQIVDGSGNPFQISGGQNATLDDLGLGTVPVGSNPAVRVVPWSTIPSDIAQMAHHDGRLFFGTTSGHIWEYDRLGNRESIALLSIGDQRAAFSTDGPFAGQGMRGFAFHPDFNNNGLLYTMHRESPSGGIATHGNLTESAIAHYVLGEWDFNSQVGGNPAFRSVLRVGYAATDHPGGQIGFNPAVGPTDSDYGLLYLGFGDGGGACSGSDTCIDQFGHGQDFGTIQSSIIRIDPRQSGDAPYAVPSDNPFLAATDPDNVIPDEMFAKGFRNPSTMMFDQVTGSMFVGDISQNTIEEINLIESGRNYGWGIREGTWLFTDLTNASDSIRYVPLGDGSDVTATSATYSGFDAQGLPVVFADINRQTDEFTSPVAQFSHEANGGTSAVVTGTVYRGSAVPELENLFLFGNLSQDEIYYVDQSDLVNDESPGQVFELQLQDANGNPTSLASIVGSNRTNIRFGQDDLGEIYLISKHNNVIYRLEQGRFSTPSIIGDLDLDGDIDMDDVAAFQAGWLDRFLEPGVESWMSGDLNLDGVTNLADLALMHNALVNAGQPSPFGSGNNTPEPSTAVVCVVTLASVFFGRYASRYRRSLLHAE
jgi:hypothetical protein